MLWFEKNGMALTFPHMEGLLGSLPHLPTAYSLSKVTCVTDLHKMVKSNSMQGKQEFLKLKILEKHRENIGNFKIYEN